jgi:hypothetical protein
MHNLQDLEVMLQFGRDREMSLLRSTRIARSGEGGARRWIGHQLVRTGTWLANERPMRPASAG